MIRAFALVLAACTSAPAAEPPVRIDAAAAVPVVPAWIPPHAPAAVCSEADLEGYREACLESATALPIACQQFVAAHQACAECILPAGGAPAGALLPRAGAVVPNVGGCIATALDDPSDTGCGAREQAARDCIDAVCADAADCRASARAGVCAELAMKTCPELAVGAPCALAQGLAEDFRRVARRLCGR